MHNDEEFGLTTKTNFLYFLVTPLCQTVAALIVAKAPEALWKCLVWLPFFFGPDLAVAASGLWGTIQQRPQQWEERKSRA